MQLVGERRGLRFYDDSKATNVDSVVAGVDGFPRRSCSSPAGATRAARTRRWCARCRENRCRAVVLIGEAADKIAAALASDEIRRTTPCRWCAPRRWKRRSRAPSTRAQAGDAVVLSPACSSYDMFDNYEHRGRVFAAAVEAL